MGPTELKIYRFPSGRTHVIHPLVKFEGDGKPKPLQKRDRACKHVGKSLKVKNTCMGAGRDSVWECNCPGLTGKCAPLAILPIAEPGVVTCTLCDQYEPAATPGYFQLGKEFLSALDRWVKAGRPVRPQEQVNELLKVCLSCPFVARNKDGSTWCGKCGCPVNDKTDNPLLHRNKLVMKTESCPADPPMWSDTPNPAATPAT